MIDLRMYAAAATLALAAAACGSIDPATTTSTSGSGGSAGATSSTAATSGTGGSTPGKMPVNHRASAAACDSPRQAFDQGDASGKCLKDAECTTGLNGRCVAFLGKPSFCSYDACKADAECGSASVCACRNGPNFSANTCFHGNCQVDADCGGGGYCSPSAVSLDIYCTMGVPQGSYGYFCHTAADECVDDADCAPNPTGQGACFFQPDKARWACQELLCVD